MLGSDHRLVWLVAGVVGFGGLAAVLLYRYVAVPGFGPVPGMYEPAWYAEKTLSAIAEGGVGVLRLLREALRRHTPLTTADPAGLALPGLGPPARVVGDVRRGHRWARGGPGEVGPAR